MPNNDATLFVYSSHHNALTAHICALTVTAKQTGKNKRCMSKCERAYRLGAATSSPALPSATALAGGVASLLAGATSPALGTSRRL